MSFLYPRTVSITRPAAQTGAGVQGYGGAVRANETSVASSIAANIQLARTGNHKNVGLPADTAGSTWFIYFMPNAVAIYNRDIITDDLGRRYRVDAAYPSPMGIKCAATLLEV